MSNPSIPVKDSNEVYKSYKTPNGIVSFTKEEFDAIVKCFRILKQWRDELKLSRLDAQADGFEPKKGGLKGYDRVEK
jgi:hypothetical protein